MSIAKINKIEFVGLKEDKDRFLTLLQHLGMVELVASEEPSPYIETEKISESDILEIEESLSFLSTFQKKAGFLEKMVSLKPVIYREKLKEIVSTFDYHNFLRELAGLRHQLKDLTQHKEGLDQEKRHLLPWHKLSVLLGETHPTKRTRLLLGILSSRDYPKLAEDFEKENIDLFFEAVTRDNVNTYIAFVCMEEDSEKFEEVLKRYRFNFVTLGDHRCTVKERLLGVNKESAALDDGVLDVKNKILELLKEQPKLVAVYDYLENIRIRLEADKTLTRQKFTFSCGGWVKSRDIGALKKALSGEFKGLVIFISDPKPGEDVPVDLENSRIIQPFEFITRIYGFPKYNEIDPTPYLAPFFFLYFGFCVSDVGYGFILAALSFFVLKKFKIGPQGSRFFRLFLFCGISTMIIGALTGSWFGNLFDLLAEGNRIFLPLRKFKDSLIIIDPLREPTKLLGIALSFGIIQVWFGNIVAGIGNIKNKRYLNVLFDQVPMLTFLFGLTGIGLIFLKLLDKTDINLFKYAALISAVALILTQGRSEKGIGSKLFYGIYNFYNAISGYLSDVLSYSRLWALGLVTGVMAGTVNLISVQFSQIFTSLIPFIDRVGFIKVIVSSVILIVIFVFGHIASFFMNLLGAFVHPLRLQFVEFFSKFFKAGGSSFKPLKVETKYINLK